MAKTKPFRTIKVKKHPHYGAVKAALRASQQVVLNARAAMATANAQLHRTLVEAGLDPAKQYDLNDEGETITLRTT